MHICSSSGRWVNSSWPDAFTHLSPHLTHHPSHLELIYQTPSRIISQLAKFMGPTWGPTGSCRPQMGPMLAPWTLLSGLPSFWFCCHYRCTIFALFSADLSENMEDNIQQMQKLIFHPSGLHISNCLWLRDKKLPVRQVDFGKFSSESYIICLWQFLILEVRKANNFGHMKPCHHYQLSYMQQKQNIC